LRPLIDADTDKEIEETVQSEIRVISSLHLQSICKGSGHKVSAIWGWTIFEWAMKNATISLWGYEKYQVRFVGLLKYLAKWMS